MIATIVQSSMLLIFATVAAQLMRRRSAALKHFVLATGVVSSLAVPAVSLMMPRLQITTMPVFQSLGIQDLPPDVQPTVPSELRVNTSGLSAPSKVSSRALGNIFLWIWISGTSVIGGVLIIGAARIVWLSWHSQSLTDTAWTEALNNVSDALQLRRRLRLAQNDRSVLGTWGFLRPSVLLPRDAQRWPEERIRVVLMHELAHIKRFDWPVQILAEIARSIYWFNPLFWIVCRRLRSESEHACDDVVLNNGYDAKDYASHLLDLARSLKKSARVWTPVLAMSDALNLERRFIAMLNPTINRRSPTRGIVFGIAVAAICVTMPLAAMRAPAPQETPRTASTPIAVARATTPEPARAIEPTPRRTERITVTVPARKTEEIPPSAIQVPADGSLSGAVSDSTGAVVPGVTITLMRIDGSGLVTTTNETGRFDFRTLQPGVYTLTAQLPGFSNAARRVEIRSAAKMEQNITLLVGNLTSEVRVSAAGQPRPTPPPTGPQRIRVGGNIQAAMLVSQVKPVYPQNARDAGIQGTVQLQGILAVDGTLLGLRVISSKDPDLALAAMDAVRQWRYRPTLLNGEPVEVVTDITVGFELQ